MSKNNIGVSATKVIVRILLFLLYYIILIGIGIATIYAIVMLTIRFLIPTLLAMPKGYITLLIIAGWAGLCCFGLMLALFLIKPLFSITKSNAADNSIEIERDDCPLLFEAIEDIVKNTGNKMPKHVFLSADVNACVFFDSSFWSIFLPIRKNLKIGLGLFEDLSIDELKSIIAHEFGHFGQNSMKIGSTVYVVNQILYSLTYSYDFWDNMLRKWRSSSVSAFAFFGDVTGLFANIVRHMNISMYRFVEKSYMQLSRQMEFDADAVSCRYIGSDVFVSAICKTEINSDNNETFLDILKQLISERKVVSNYFDAGRITKLSVSDEESRPIQYDVLLSQPLKKDLHESRVQIENIWDSHPSLLSRIEEALRIDVKSHGIPKDSWELIPEQIRQKVSDEFFSKINDISNFVVLSPTEYKEWMKKYVDKAYMPSHLRPFFGRSPLPFNTSEKAIIVYNPFTEKNKEIINEYIVASSDWDILKGLWNGNVEVESIKYNQRIYTKDSLPIEEHRAYFEDLVNKVAAIDRNVYHFLNSNCDKKGFISYLYETQEYAYNSIYINLKNLISARNELHENLITFVARSEDDSSYIKGCIIQYVDYLIESIKELNLNHIKTVTGEEYVSSLVDLIQNAHNDDLYFDNDYLNRMVISLPNELIDIHQSLLSMVKRELCNITTNILKSYSSQEVEEHTEEVQGIERITIELPEENDYKNKDNTTLKTWLYFGAYFVVVCTLCFSLYYCGQGENPKKVHDGKTFYTNINANEDEISDGRIALKIPSGLQYDKIAPDSSNTNYFGFILTDNRNNPTYQIKVYSDYIQGAFGANELAEFLRNYDQSIGLDSVKNETKAGCQDLLDSNSKLYCFITQTIYETNPRFKADIAVIRSYETSTICFVISESLEKTITPFEDVVKGIRFK